MTTFLICVGVIIVFLGYAVLMGLSYGKGWGDGYGQGQADALDGYDEAFRAGYNAHKVSVEIEGAPEPEIVVERLDQVLRQRRAAPWQ